MRKYDDLDELERLELAAKAVGLETIWDQPKGAARGRCRIKRGALWSVWCPRDDDAESFRLSVSLDMQIEHVGRSNGMTTEVNVWPRGRGDCSACQKYGDDKHAATRLAIFDAAVLLGLTISGIS